MTAQLVLHVDRAGRAGREWQLPDNLVPGQPGFCRGCPVRIMWARNPATGKSSPWDTDGTSHWATCPSAEQLRRKP